MLATLVLCHLGSATVTGTQRGSIPWVLVSVFESAKQQTAKPLPNYTTVQTHVCLCACLCSEHQKAQQERQRQAAAEARLAEQAAESAARQRHAARSDAVSAYKTLLAEVVRDAGATYNVWQPKLAKDPLVSTVPFTVLMAVLYGTVFGQLRWS